MDFPITDLMDEQACYQRLVAWLHPNGLSCPACQARERLGIHRRHRQPIIDYQCGNCGRVFNAFTGTALEGSRRSCVQLVLILRGFAQGVSTNRLARELGCDRPKLLGLRHKLQHWAWQLLPREVLPDQEVEADEMFQNAGEKRDSASRSGRSAKAACQQAARARFVRAGSAASGRRRRSGKRPVAHTSGTQG